MFSRGNVKEKARIMAMGTVRDAVGCAAVDLYAGIGYFAFPYRRAGVRTVVGWEINGWSVEGLRRGAGLNGWGVRVVVPGGGGGGEEGDGGALEGEEEERDFVVFCEDNAHAARRVEGMRQRLPPVRHVNAGLLPTSRGAWETAVRVLEPRLGGWMHLHENFGEREVRERAEEVVGEVRRIWGKVRAERCGGGLEVGADVGDVVRLEHVERVKTYAPGVLHCVLDIWIAPTGTKPRA
ncbi:tRNA wybutosine-synthesizing protein 2 [Diplodia seriata]|uniref:tRNA(Phe) (4-demethylwyosine(37)-C(7)) aminocarboxypropyltransferase n=1 Tax=Diplodia seriata TaxID=420778 RepID=A0A1S8BF77_9PEZI|nr:tRNA wybutosine-synthesizing protein 2 [Diplodia seriata]